MYRVAIIINENEVSHSKFADTLGVVRKSIEKFNCKGKFANSYNFSCFDKFNICKLFEAGENNLMLFDSLIIATNAVGRNEKIHNVLCENKTVINKFLEANKGIFISSQKKLSNGGLPTDSYSSVGFLDEKYDYYLFDRPEKYSSEGTISLSTEHNLVSYPHHIDEDLVKKHCENNQFMEHRYRSIIIPRNENSYKTILFDNSSPSLTIEKLNSFNGNRKLLLVSKLNSRIVVSTMALDWANHEELLCNIVIFITEDKPLSLFIKKKENENEVINSYIIRANISNLPYRVISKTKFDDFPISLCNAFILSSEWSAKEIENFFKEIQNKHEKYFSIYHISHTDNNINRSHKLLKYSNFSSTDIMKDAVVDNIISSFIQNSWNKSVWTFSYILKLISFYNINIEELVPKIYKELSNHFTKKDHKSDKRILTGSFDNVFNATCKLLDILRYFYYQYPDDLLNNTSYNLDAVIKTAEDWLLDKVKSEKVYDQDICYYVNYLIEQNLYDSLPSEFQKMLLGLFDKLITQLMEEIVAQKINLRASIDLCRIYQTLCHFTTKNIIPTERTKTYLEQIELLLSDRQNVFGCWKNDSETAEVTLMLLEVYKERIILDVPSEEYNVLITKGIQYLRTAFDSNKKMWSEDLGATAKAMYSIGQFDKIFNYAVNDFFIDLNNTQENLMPRINENDFQKTINIYKNINNLESIIKEFDAKNHDKNNLLKKYKRRAIRSSSLSVFFIAILVIISFVLIIVFSILYTDYNSIFNEIIGDWKNYIIGAFVGLAITIVYTLINNGLKKIIKAKNGY